MSGVPYRTRADSYPLRMRPGTPVVGLRGAALQQLEATLTDARTHRRMRVVALTGEAGSGKTTLLLELRRRLTTWQEDVQIGYGRALGASGTDNARQRCARRCVT